MERQKTKYGSRFDASDLASKFIPYFNSQERITVDFGFEVKRGRIGVTTGWKPAFLLMLRRNSMGSIWLLHNSDKIVEEK
jgi:hypothetical protein